MPTTRRRHAVTETPLVQAALDELRRELGTDRVELGELVVLGAGAKVAALRAQREDERARLERLAQRVRSRRVCADVAAADEVRARGWARG
jgi:GAF domain-containing protein